MNVKQKEEEAAKKLHRQIEKEKAKHFLTALPIQVGGRTFRIKGCELTPETGGAKSDFHLIDINNREVVWISHKAGRRPQHFQQWGGISPKFDRMTATHLETKKWVKDLKEHYDGKLPSATTAMRRIKSPVLKKRSVYGTDFGKSQHVRNNVSLVIQGDPLLYKYGSMYRIKGSSVTHKNGDSVTGDYEPSFYAVYKGDRSDNGIKNARITVNPAKNRLNAKSI